MACETITKKAQTIQQRAEEIRRAVMSLDKALVRRQVRPVVGPQGAITFVGWPQEQRDGVTDACAYRRIMSGGSSLAKSEIARAEQMAGKSVDRRVIAAGVHSHDGGHTWGKE